jgi:hypothetical protein
MAKEVKAEEAKENSIEKIKSSISKKIQGGFDLDKFKKAKSLDKNIGFKKQEWIPVSKAFQDATGIPGIPVGHISVLRGHSDTGKTTLMIEAAVNAQKMGKLPVFIITEMKWSWEHVKLMGFKCEETVDEETGEISFTGNFLYVDRSSLKSIEDVAAFIADLLDEQKKGNLPKDLVFLWDSIGSIPCNMSIESKKNNNEWNAGAMSTQFGNFINQQIVMSRKLGQDFTNSLVCVNKIWVAKPASFMEQPKMKNKNGETMYSDCSLLVTFGNISNQGTSKIKATKNGKEVEFGKRTKVQIEKNHITGITTSTKIIATPHGFIYDDKKFIEQYKKAHSHEWAKILGSEDFDIEEEADVKEDFNNIMGINEE